MNNYEEIPNKYNESGYHKIEEKKVLLLIVLSHSCPNNP